MSGRGSNSDEERAVVVVERAENNNNDNNNEAAEDAALDQHQRDHSGLLTIGEKCVHLICAFIRMFWTTSELFGVTVTDVAVSLSRLSRTCRTMYVYVRNLPSVFELPRPPFSRLSLPWGRFGLDLGYWTDIAGLVWEVHEPQQLLSLIDSDPSGDRSSTDDTRMGNLFLHLQKLTCIDSRDAAECNQLLRILERCGGLSISLYGSADLIRHLGLDLRRCKSLKFLHADVDLRKDFSQGSYEALIGQCAEMEATPQYASLVVTDTDLGVLTDLSAFRGFQQIRTFSMTKLRSLEGLQHARYVDLRNMCLTDVSALAHVHTVKLSQCSNITDVSALANVHTVELSHCSNVTDVSALATVHAVKLYQCSNVTDVSALATVHAVKLYQCSNVTDVSALATVHTVELSECSNVTDVSMLGHVYSVKLSECSNVTDVSALATVHTLSLSLCDNITEVSPLCSVHTLRLFRCVGITDVSTLSTVKVLQIMLCANVINVNELSNLSRKGAEIYLDGDLSLVDWSYRDDVTDVSALANVHTLNLAGCISLTDVSMLGHVHVLDLSHCIVTDVRALGGVHTLNLAWCDWLTDVSALGTVHHLNLSHCNGITDVSALHSVTYLRLVKCRRVMNASTLINKVPYLML